MKFLLAFIILCLCASLSFNSCSNNIVTENEICANNIDDDGDGLVDCNDPDCAADSNCSQLGSELCNNNIDDDGDGLIDCDDSDCNSDVDCDFDYSWTDVTSFNNQIRELKVFEDKLFITGGFTKREGLTCYWSSVYSDNSFIDHSFLIGGSGIDALTIFDNQLYGAGALNQSTTIGQVKWNVSTWDISGPSIGEGHSSIYTDGITLYLGSDFGKVSYRQVNSSYVQFPVLPGSKYVSTITEFDGSLIVGGDFDNSVKKWNGNEWETLGGGTNGTIRKLIVYKDKLIACGSFNEIGGQSITDIAIWDGTSWSSVGGSVPHNSMNGIRDMLVRNNALYVVGDFTSIGDKEVRYAAKWNGNDWESLGFDIGDAFPLAIEVYKNKLYIGTSDFYEAHLYSRNL